MLNGDENKDTLKCVELPRRSSLGELITCINTNKNLFKVNKITQANFYKIKNLV